MNDNQPLVPETPSSEPATPAAAEVAQDTGALIQDAPAPAPSAEAAPKVKPKMKSGIKIAIILSVILLVAAIIVGVILIFVNIENGRKDTLRNDAISFAKIVQDAKDNINIYTFEEYGEKANLNKSPYDEEYTKESYVTNYNDHIFVCLYDGTHRVSGYTSHELTIDEDGECKYEFLDHSKMDDEYDYNEKTAYIKNYTTKNYGFLEPSFEEKNGKVVVDNNYFTYEVDVKFENNKAVVESTLEEAEAKFYGSDSLLKRTEYYVKNRLKTGSFGSGQINSIFQIEKVSYPYIRIVSNMSYTEAEKFMDEYYKFAQEKKFEMRGKVIDIVALNQAGNDLSYDIIFGQKNSTGEWLILKENYEK